MSKELCSLLLVSFYNLVFLFALPGVLNPVVFITGLVLCYSLPRIFSSRFKGDENESRGGRVKWIYTVLTIAITGMVIFLTFFDDYDGGVDVSGLLSLQTAAKCMACLGLIAIIGLKVMNYVESKQRN
ncbi:hypothetical protein [Candidatus Pantoea multigeneris]|uniref:Uncharacterized protein n=1 Tax=Candidatus Pantoea multigeneris TaxID=2608357 RepID=A0ABX0RF95_9GAMM|nr:hypothetical protein [Pantoea multigeneris]NIF24036.1 hypothetical protein [Pantoea multigeneris]